VKLICEQENEIVMFNSISWGQYLKAAAFIVTGYYLIIGYKYYRWEILSLMGIKKIGDNKIGYTAAVDFKKSFVTENPEDNLLKTFTATTVHPAVQSFRDEVKAFVQDADDDLQKEVLLGSLQRVAAKYPILKNADYKNELVQFVLTESNTRYPGILQPADVNELWD
jgi:hypothetical protein